MMERTDTQAWSEAEAPVSVKGRKFLTYWHALCPEEGFPRRSDIAPSEIPSLLPYIFLLDVLRAEPLHDFRFRLVGTAIVAIEGELTGQCLSGLFPDRSAHDVLWRQYYAAAAGKISVRHETLAWQDRDHVGYEVILAPLQDDSGEITMLIGLAHAQEK